MKSTFDCSIGDSLFIETQNGTRELKIHGFIVPNSMGIFAAVEYYIITKINITWLCRSIHRLSNKKEKNICSYI